MAIFDWILGLIWRLLVAVLLMISGGTSPYNFDTDLVPSGTYDFVIVGAGCAGSIVAARLSETKARVLVLEAGGTVNPGFSIPVLSFLPILDQSVHWDTQPENGDGISTGYDNNAGVYFSGRGVGGGCSINSLAYVRGSPFDYDNWAKLGNQGWDFKSTLPYFKKTETYLGPKTPETEAHRGHRGPVSITPDSYTSRYMGFLKQGWKELGFERILDGSENVKIGLAPFQFAVGEGVRASSAETHLRPAMKRDNLHVRNNALVTKILFDKEKRVVGVQYQYEGKIHKVDVRKEVILSAGAFHTPKVLMLSGVGPREHLKDMKIPVVAGVEGVGKNLQEHAGFFGLPVDIEDGMGLTLPNPLTMIREYRQNKTGFLTSPIGLESNAYINLMDENKNWPDLSFVFDSTTVGFDKGWSAKKALRFKDENFDSVYGPHLEKGCGVTMSAVIARPKSSGWVLLKSKDPLDHPYVNFNLLDHPDDLEVLVKGMQFLLKKLLQTRALKDGAGARFISKPIPGCSDMEFLSDDYWRCFVKSLIRGGWHPTSSSKMAPASDPLGVVDNRLRVRGVSGLRVADASIMPMMVSSNPMATIYMIGEKGADIIKQDWNYPTEPIDNYQDTLNEKYIKRPLKNTKDEL